MSTTKNIVLKVSLFECSSVSAYLAVSIFRAVVRGTAEESFKQFRIKSKSSVQILDTLSYSQFEFAQTAVIISFGIMGIVLKKAKSNSLRIW